MLSDIIAPGRLRSGEPQALAALIAVAGWPVVAYCERAGAGDDVASAVVLAFVTFRRRTIEAGDEAAADLEQILLESTRDAVDEVRGEAPEDDASQAADAALAHATPRPLSPRLATALLRALVDAAPVDGDPPAVRVAAERSYAEAYQAAEPAAQLPGEQRLAPASPLLVRAVEARRAGTEPAEPAPPPAAAPSSREPARATAPPAPSGARPGTPAQPATSGDEPAPAQAAARPGTPALLARLMSLPPLMRAAVFGLALVLLLIAGAAISGDDKPVAPRAVTVTVTTPATTTAPAAPARSQVVRGKPREPFSASGARFEVVPSATASWARQVREDAPRRGSRWVTIAVRSRNVSRRDLVLRSLGYRLRTSAGVVLGPRFIEVAEGPARARRGRLPTRSRASVHLGFELPSGVRSVSLAFEPGGLDEPTALVALGVQA